MRVVVDVYLRPSTKEYFLLNYNYLGFIEPEGYLIDDIDLFMDEHYDCSIWTIFADKMDKRSIYKVNFILDILWTKNYDHYNGGYEIDTLFEIVQILCLERAEDFKELRDGIANISVNGYKSKLTRN